MTCNHQSNRPLLSVLMPVFNAEAYVGEAIESILGQSFRDFEFIIIDDGSTDNSLSVLKRYAAQDARIRLISRENRGLVATLNEGIALARGEWIARMDADDVALAHRLVSQLTFLQENQLEICGASVQLIGTGRGYWHYPRAHAGCEAELLFGVPFAHPTVIAHARVFKELRYAAAWSLVEDYDLWQRAWAAGFKMGNVPEVLLQYRVHRQQTSSFYRRQQAQNSQQIRSRHWQQLLSIKLGISAIEAHDAERDPWKTLRLLGALKQCYKGTEAEKFLRYSFLRLCSHRFHGWVLNYTS
ncbi:glycosyltransferase family 2 protein [Thermosynechococcus vestitus]|uniref:glycosyltransferase family 2 protein n=1 Tax=Thermosynechococcus vestitus TaxID=146786 RepID=UPI0002D6FB2E|nr:glycosyltransferase [Thermosynechococcus vestitus]